MSAQDVFQSLSTPEARMALAPLMALGLGVVLFLLCDVVDALRPARALVFGATLAAAACAELRILLGERAPGRVFDGTLVCDHATALWGLLFLAATFFTWLASQGYYRENRPFKPEHDALVLTAPIGMMLMVGARDLVVFFVGLELLSIPLYALCAFRRMCQESVEAGIKYFLLGSFSSALFL